MTSNMNASEFDKFADEYKSLHANNIRASGESPAYFARYKVQDVAQVLGGQSQQALRVLDFGAGVGTSVPYFRELFANVQLTCLDVSRKSLELGELQFAGQADFVAFDGKTIPFPDNSFDLTFAACVSTTLITRSTSHCSVNCGVSCAPKAASLFLNTTP